MNYYKMPPKSAKVSRKVVQKDGRITEMDGYD